MARGGHFTIASNPVPLVNTHHKTTEQAYRVPGTLWSSDRTSSRESKGRLDEGSVMIELSLSYRRDGRINIEKLLRSYHL